MKSDFEALESDFEALKLKLEAYSPIGEHSVTWEKVSLLLNAAWLGEIRPSSFNFKAFVGILNIWR